MSLDLYFLRPTPGRTWAELMAALEEEELRPLDNVDRARWESIKARLADVLPDAEVADSEGACELNDSATGIQLLLSSGELSLSATDPRGGPDAERLGQLLRHVVTVVEDVTGLTAYDPQADAPFGR